MSLAPCLGLCVWEKGMAQTALCESSAALPIPCRGGTAFLSLQNGGRQDKPAFLLAFITKQR